MTIKLNAKWAALLLSQPETGMGYQIVTVVTRDGRRFDDVMVVGGTVSSIKGSPELPFTQADIREITVAHGK